MLSPVDRFEGTCHLDWWANSSTNLFGEEVSIVITTEGAAWSARGRLIDDGGPALEGFAFLCELDSVSRCASPTAAPSRSPSTRPPNPAGSA